MNQPTVNRAHYLLYGESIPNVLAELAEAQPCPDCTGRPAVCVEGDDEWEIVEVHDVTCPNSKRAQRLAEGDRGDQA
jgi:hypothetical protein